MKTQAVVFGVLFFLAGCALQSSKVAPDRVETTSEGVEVRYSSSDELRSIAFALHVSAVYDGGRSSSQINCTRMFGGRSVGLRIVLEGVQARFRDLGNGTVPHYLVPVRMEAAEQDQTDWNQLISAFFPLGPTDTLFKSGYHGVCQKKCSEFLTDGGWLFLADPAVQGEIHWRIRIDLKRGEESARVEISRE